MNVVTAKTAWAEITAAIHKRAPQRGVVMCCERYAGRDGRSRVTITVEGAAPFTDCRVVVPLPATDAGLMRGMELIGKEIHFIPAVGDAAARIVIGRMVE